MEKSHGLGPETEWHTEKVIFTNLEIETYYRLFFYISYGSVAYWNQSIWIQNVEISNYTPISSDSVSSSVSRDLSSRGEIITTTNGFSIFLIVLTLLLLRRSKSN